MNVIRFGTKCLWLAVVVFVAAAVSGFLVGRNQGKITERRNERIKEQETTHFTEGPWGLVRYWDTLLEMPADLISMRSRPESRTQWYFGMMSPDDIARALRSCELEKGLIDRLIATAQPAADGGYVLFPDDDMVLALPPEKRAKLYSTLNQWGQNAPIRDATRFQKVGARDWLDDSKMPHAASETVRKLIYRQGDTQLFVDYDVVLRKLSDNMDARNFLRTMTRQNCFMGTIVVRPGDNLDRLTAYWGLGGREREVRTLLESAKMSDARHEVPLIMLMPHFVRDRLYRYRNADDPALANCHYTAMNFFSTMPNEAFTNLGECARAIDTEYVAVTSTNHLLGDVLLFMIDEHRVVHSANYIAGNIVFTKNGSALGQPWALADLNALKNYFSIEEPVTVSVIRRKEFVGAP